MKINLRIIKWGLMSVGTAAVFSSLLLICSPTAGAFGGSTASCAGADSVSCSGYRCESTNNVGCTCYDRSGKVEDTQSCKKKGDEFEIMLEVSAY